MEAEPLRYRATYRKSDVIRLFEETKKAFGTLDILVNNAAHQQYLPIGQVSVETFHQHFNVNVLGAILAIQASLKLFSDKGGNIINISSGASKYPLPGASLYSATKAAIKVCRNDCFVEGTGCKKHSYQFYFARPYGNRRCP